MPIKDVDFGRLDAEAEVNLADYFVDTGVLHKLRTGRKQYVIGRKGSGKTALFKLASEKALGQPVISMEFSDYPWAAHKQIREAEVTAESAFVTSWRFTIFAAICQHWADRADGEVKKSAQAHIEAIYGGDVPGVLEMLVDRLKRLRKIDLPSVEGFAGLGGLELEPAGEGPALARSLGQWCRVLQDFVAQNHSEFPVTVMLDRLDEGWDATDDSKMLMAGALKAARDVNLRLARPNKPAAAITFLRSDIYNELSFNDKNKINADIEFLDWNEDTLIDVAEARIARSLSCNKTGAWARVFSSDEMRQRASIRSYVLKRTMLRPRDMIAFCLNCQEVAVADQAGIVATSHVYRAEEKYSHHIYDELDDEMHKQVPDARAILQAVREMGSTRFTFANWMETLRRRGESAGESKAQGWLRVLFDYSIVGVQKRGGVTRGTTFRFIYNDRLLEPNFDGEMIVHPSLTKYLSLRAPRRTQAIPQPAARLPLE